MAARRTSRLACSCLSVKASPHGSHFKCCSSVCLKFKHVFQCTDRDQVKFFRRFLIQIYYQGSIIQYFITNCLSQHSVDGWTASLHYQSHLREFVLHLSRVENSIFFFSMRRYLITSYIFILTPLKLQFCSDFPQMWLTELAIAPSGKHT